MLIKRSGNNETEGFKVSETRGALYPIFLISTLNASVYIDPYDNLDGSNDGDLAVLNRYSAYVAKTKKAK